MVLWHHVEAYETFYTHIIMYSQYKLYSKLLLTTVVTAPGFCTLRAFTTWNTSTTPSVLHLSIVVAMAQNIPDLLTVSLHDMYSVVDEFTIGRVYRTMCNKINELYMQCVLSHSLENQ